MTPEHANAISQLHQWGIFLFLVGMVYLAVYLVIKGGER